MWCGRLQWGYGTSCQLPDCHIWIMPAPPAFTPWKNTSGIFIHLEFTVSLLTQDFNTRDRLKSNSTDQILVQHYQYKHAITFFWWVNTNCFNHQLITFLVLVGLFRGLDFLISLKPHTKIAHIQPKFGLHLHYESCF